ncbi:DUF5719 family protein, partial [Angustibacter speluncae]
ATGAVDPRGWSHEGAVVAEQPSAGEVDLGGRPSVLVCPPAPRLGAEVGSDAGDEDFRADSPARTSTVLRTVGGQAVSALTLPADEEPPAGLHGTASGDGTVVATDGVQPVVLQAGPEASVGALAVHVADDGDLAGLAASSCGFPAESSVLVGGGVEAGRSGRVVLSNPGTTTASVDLVLLTPSGPVSPPAAQDLAVPGGTSRDVLLEGLVEPTPALAVGVTARGGAVVAHLVDTRIAGVRAQGVEQVTATQPATALTLPGLLPGPTTTAVLRLANPGSTPAAVGWQLTGPDGAVAQQGETVVTVPAGSVAEVPLEELTGPAAAEALAVQVTSDQPVAATVQVRLGRAGGLADLAVAHPAPRLAGQALVPLPDGEGVRAALALAGTDRAGTVEVVGLDADGEQVGETEEVRVEPGRTALVAVPADSVQMVLRVASGEVAAAVVLRSEPDGGPRASYASVLPVLVPPPAPASVVVGQLSPDVLRAPAGSAP